MAQNPCSRRGSCLQLQVAVDEIVLLQAPEPLPDLARAALTDPFDGLELPVGGADDRVEALEAVHHASDHGLREARDVGEHAVTPGSDAVVERVDGARVAEQLGELLEAE